VSPRGLVVGVSDLLRRPGARRAVQRVLDSPGHVVGGVEVPVDAEIEVDLVVEATADPNTLSLSGVVRAPWTGECRRCLDPVGGILELDVRELFSREPDTAGDEDIWPIEAEQIDVAAVVADAILLALPLAPLCGPECRGPAPDEFPAQVADENVAGPGADTDENVADPRADTDENASDEEVVDVRDPRWSALDDLRFD
jgi:uncharacterized protein